MDQNEVRLGRRVGVSLTPHNPCPCGGVDERAPSARLRDTLASLPPETGEHERLGSVLGRVLLLTSQGWCGVTPRCVCGFCSALRLWFLLRAASVVFARAYWLEWSGKYIYISDMV